MVAWSKNRAGNSLGIMQLGSGNRSKPFGVDLDKIHK